MNKIYEQTHSAYDIGLHSIHKAYIHSKFITTASNETCDSRLMHSYNNSLENPNMYLLSSIKSYFYGHGNIFTVHYCRLWPKVNPYLQQNFPLPVSVHTCIRRQQFSPALEEKRMMHLTPNYFHYSRIIYAIFITIYITWGSYSLRFFYNSPGFRSLPYFYETVPLWYSKRAINCRHDVANWWYVGYTTNQDSQHCFLRITNILTNIKINVRLGQRN